MIKYKSDERPENRERRRHRRCAVFWPGQITCQGCSINFDLLDISAGGARIHLSAPLIESSPVMVRIDRVGEFRAEIVWRGLDDAGLRFLDEAEEGALCRTPVAARPCAAFDAPPCLAVDPGFERCRPAPRPANDDR